MKRRVIWAVAIGLALVCGALCSQAADFESGQPQDNLFQPRLQLDTRLTLGPPTKCDSSSDHSEAGYHFHYGTQEVGFGVEVGFGTGAFGGKATHDMVLGAIQYGWFFTDVVAQDHWWRGNWELMAKVFGGGQYHPNTAYVAGMTPMLRYNFATRTRWVPFVGGGAGLAATDIGLPDLSTKFEFNLQAGAGVHYFWRDNAAITFQGQMGHFSNAHIRSPDVGVNTAGFSVGLSWFF